LSAPFPPARRPNPFNPFPKSVVSDLPTGAPNQSVLEIRCQQPSGEDQPVSVYQNAA
jgi:hypothetical protein